MPKFHKVSQAVKCHSDFFCIYIYTYWRPSLVPRLLPMRYAGKRLAAGSNFLGPNLC